MDSSLKKDSLRPRVLAVSILIFVLVYALALHQRTGAAAFLSLQQEWRNLTAMVHLSLAKVFHWSFYLKRTDIIQNQPYYLETVSRFRITFYTAISGAAVAVSGAVYQYVFRNDLASPAMLGVTNGVNFAVLGMVLVYSQKALSLSTMGYLFCYGAAGIVLLLVLLCGKVVPKGDEVRQNATMLLAGCVIAQLGSALTSAAVQLLSTEDYEVYTQLTSYGWGVSTGKDLLILVGSLLPGFVPLLFLRHSVDLLTFSDREVSTMGLRPQLLRLISLLSGSLLVTAAVIACSNVGMMAILTPHLSRALFGQRFKTMLLSCALYGATFLLICRMIAVYFSFGSLSTVFTLNAVVGLICTPLTFVILISRGRREGGSRG